MISALTPLSRSLFDRHVWCFPCTDIQIPPFVSRAMACFCHRRGSLSCPLVGLLRMSSKPYFGLVNIAVLADLATA